MKLANTLMINETILPSNKRAFTLAEVLITLSILGIVAALTIPSLVNRQSDLAAQVKLKKAIATYENVVGVYMVEKEATNAAGLILNDAGAAVSCAQLSNYFKIVEGPTPANNGCDFVTADGAAWHISTQGAQAAQGVQGQEGYVAAVNDTRGYATIADSKTSPRYAVFVWAKNGQVNGTGTTDSVGNGPTSLITTLYSGAVLKPSTRLISPANEFMKGIYTCPGAMTNNNNKPACGAAAQQGG